ncbi:FZ domain-containing protein [Durusdinium trenchii]|uniref:FZ domain-containing protein n=1 Tax=Durusdinium trenchii TaxID=1381693 RepID=A0ABP0JT71_9DINO
MAGRNWLWVSGLAALAVSVAASAQHATGTCKPYPGEGGFCSDVIGGENVFVYDTMTIEDMDAAFETRVAVIFGAAGPVATEECFFGFRRLLCLTTFPICDAASSLPRRPCRAGCLEVIDATDGICKDVVSLGTAVGMGHLIVSCDAVIGDASNTPQSIYTNYYSPWDGAPAFVDETYTEGGEQLSCVPYEAGGVCEPMICPEPMLPRSFPLEIPGKSLRYTIPEDLDYCIGLNASEVDCERCKQTCEFPCPYPLIYSDGEYTILWLVQWLPGLLSAPLNALVAFTEFQKMRKLRGKGSVVDATVLIAACFNIVLLFLDSLPSLILHEDMRCAGEETFSYHTNPDGHPFCAFAKIKIHIIQALMFSVGCTLFRVYKQLSASQKMRKYAPGRATKWTFVICIFLIPVVLAIIDLLLQSDQVFESNVPIRLANGYTFADRGLHQANRLRYAFTCGTTVHTVLTEVLMVQAPLFVGGFAAVILSVKLYFLLRKMGHTSSGRKKTGSTSGRGTSAMKTLANNMIRFARICILLVILNTVSTLLFLPQAEDFADNIGEWATCVQTKYNPVTDQSGNAEDNSLAAGEALCGELSPLGPGLFQLLMVNLSLSIPPLAFALVFAIPILKSRKALKSAVAPTTQMTTTQSALSTAN